MSTTADPTDEMITADLSRSVELDRLADEAEAAVAAVLDRVAARIAAADQAEAAARDTLEQLPDVEALSAQLAKAIGAGDVETATTISAELAVAAPMVKAGQARLQQLQRSRPATPTIDRMFLAKLRYGARTSAYIEENAAAVARIRPLRLACVEILEGNATTVGMPRVAYDLIATNNAVLTIANTGEDWGDEAPIRKARAELDDAMRAPIQQAHDVIAAARADEAQS